MMSKKCVFNDDWLSPSLHLIQVGCKKSMAITLTHCVAYAEKLLILVIWVIGPYSVMNRAKTIKKM